MIRPGHLKNKHLGPKKVIDVSGNIEKFIGLGRSLFPRSSYLLIFCF